MINLLNNSMKMTLTCDCFIENIQYHFCWLPPGKFKMGTLKEEYLKQTCRCGQETLHIVTLTRGFWMLDTPVTQQMWDSIMPKNPSFWKGGEFPVETVSWEDCKRFCKLLSDKLQRKIKLPTEAQWEYACRAGTRTAFNCGDTLNGFQANINGRAEVLFDDDPAKAAGSPFLGKTTPVRSYSPNNWGLFDMHGNVREFCEDTFNPHISHHPAIDPCYKNESSNLHTTRGGSWLYAPIGCRCSTRECGSKENEIGFRIIMEQE
ncbi:MAG: formylglycine-generating enzyme family protein [Thermoguttaceae bacterium]|nr:formylglycine-generating enzyme family protein [Thermoguttaceae bacterium]